MIWLSTALSLSAGPDTPQADDQPFSQGGLQQPNRLPSTFTLLMRGKLLLALALGLPLAVLPTTTGSRASTNLAQNPSFATAKDGPTGAADWGSHGTMYSRVASPTHGSDSWAMRYSNGDKDEYTTCSQHVAAAKATRRYNVSVWVKSENVTGDDSGATFCA